MLGAVGRPGRDGLGDRAGHPAGRSRPPSWPPCSPGIAVRPFTLFVNKATIATERPRRLTWGAAQAGVAAGVMDAVAEGTLSEGEVDRQLLIAAVWVDPEAADEGLVFENNRVAVLEALRAGRAGRPDVAEALGARHVPRTTRTTRAEHYGDRVSPIRFDQVNLVVPDVDASRAFYAAPRARLR